MYPNSTISWQSFDASTGAVAQNGESLSDPGLNTDIPLQDPETNMLETKNLRSTLGRHGTKSITKVNAFGAYN